MKRNQKRLGNKGFSLVELIVVIAIMAVLVGVLAPTLIGNIEKSRESKDIQNLSEIQRGIVTALADEDAYKSVKNGTYTVKTDVGLSVESGDTGNLTGTTFNDTLKGIVKPVDMKSEAAEGKTIKATITDGAVKVEVVNPGATKTKGLKFIVE